eukprot:SAG11_NODE_1544_length_4716_cov_3.012995_7_plen_138_part_00
MGSNAAHSRHPQLKFLRRDRRARLAETLAPAAATSRRRKAAVSGHVASARDEMRASPRVLNVVGQAAVVRGLRLMHARVQAQPLKTIGVALNRRQGTLEHTGTQRDKRCLCLQWKPLKTFTRAHSTQPRHTRALVHI